MFNPYTKGTSSASVVVFDRLNFRLLLPILFCRLSDDRGELGGVPVGDKGFVGCSSAPNDFFQRVIENCQFNRYSKG